MNELVDTLFEYAKCGTADYKMVYEEMNLCVLLRDIIAEQYCDFEQHHIKLDIDIPEEAITVHADKKELRRALSTENAASTSGKGTGLGLAITKYILDEHKANIDVVNTIPGYVKAFVVEFAVIK